MCGPRHLPHTCCAGLTAVRGPPVRPAWGPPHDLSTIVRKHKFRRGCPQCLAIGAGGLATRGWMLHRLAWPSGLVLGSGAQGPGFDSRPRSAATHRCPRPPCPAGVGSPPRFVQNRLKAKVLMPQAGDQTTRPGQPVRHPSPGGQPTRPHGQTLGITLQNYSFCTISDNPTPAGQGGPAAVNPAQEVWGRCRGPHIWGKPFQNLCF